MRIEDVKAANSLPDTGHLAAAIECPDCAIDATGLTKCDACYNGRPRNRNAVTDAELDAGFAAMRAKHVPTDAPNYGGWSEGDVMAPGPHSSSVSRCGSIPSSLPS